MRVADYIRSLSRRWVEAMSMPAAKKKLGFHPKSEPTEREILKAYQALAKKYHPDWGGDPAKMQEVNVAKDTLIGRLKADPPSMEDYKPDPGMKYKEVKPPVEPSPPEPNIVTWEEAAKKVPTANWKFRTDDVYHGMPASMYYVLYGTLGDTHIFVRISHEKKYGVPKEWNRAWKKYLEEWEAFKEVAPDKAEELGDPSEEPARLKLEDIWKMEVFKVPLKRGDPSKVIYQMLKKLKSKLEGALVPENMKITQKDVVNRPWQYNFRPLKELFVLIKLSPAEQARKLVVLIEMARNLKKDPVLYVSVNRNEYKLHPESSKAFEKAGWIKVLWPREQEPGWRRKALQLNKHPKGKKILHWMAQYLTREPERLRWMWKAAGDQAA